MSTETNKELVRAEITYHRSLAFPGIECRWQRCASREETAMDIDPFAKIEEWGVSAQIDWDVTDTITITSVTAFRS